MSGEAPLFDLAKFGASIRAKLAALDMDQAAAAEAIGISAATLSRVAHNKGRPDVESYLRINRWLEGK